ncbi:MAG: hypothetical protein JWR58_2275 [Pseudonocardia sp.]|nr:hypothetical protein [Pseudonocardia sp.]
MSAPSKASPIASAAASLLRGADLVACGAEGLGEGDAVVVPQVTPDVAAQLQFLLERHHGDRPARRWPGSQRMSVAIDAWSAQDIRGRGVRRFRTVTWWRSTRISTSLSAVDVRAEPSTAVGRVSGTHRSVGLQRKLDDDRRPFPRAADDLDRPTQGLHPVAQADQTRTARGIGAAGAVVEN